MLVLHNTPFPLKTVEEPPAKNNMPGRSSTKPGRKKENLQNKLEDDHRQHTQK